MPRIKANLKDIDVSGGPTVPPGKYLARLENCEEQDSRAGKPMLVWTWEIIKGDYAGTNLKSFTSLQDNALFGLKGHLIGLRVEDPDEVDFDSDELLGTKAYLVVRERSYKDRDTGEQRTAASVDKVEPYSPPKKKKRRKAEEEDEEEESEDIPF